jgi:hypothetical protein
MKKLKIILLIIMLSSTTLLSSCLFPGPGRANRGGGPPHGQMERHGHHNDRGGHHNK